MSSRGERFRVAPSDRYLQDSPVCPGQLNPVEAIASALAPSKLSVKHLPVASYRAILYRVSQLDIEGVGIGCVLPEIDWNGRSAENSSRNAIIST
jgi:hypothetical protein